MEGRITYLVPRRDNLEIWMVEVQNIGAKPRKLSAFSFVEWSLGNYAFNLIEAAFAQLFNEVSYEDNVLFATMRFWNVLPSGAENPNLAWGKYAFLTSNIDPDAFDTIEEEFIGLYRGWHNPLAVERGRCSNSIGDGRDIVGVLQHDFELAPGEEKRFLIL
ncbi:MAG: glycosyl transferase family 36, partial [Armatimonadota bacterium]